MKRGHKGALLAAAAAVGWGIAGPGLAQNQSVAGQGPIATSPEALTVPESWAAELASLRASLAAAEHRIAELERQVRNTRDQLAALEGQVGGDVLPSALAGLRGGASAAAPIQVAAAEPAGAQATRPVVGEAPSPSATPENTQQIIASLPQDTAGVLTRPGHFVFEPSINYTNSDSNRLVFRGVEIVTGVQIGVIEADTAARDTVVAAGTFRYGLTDRSELELRVPYIYRSDRITTLAQRDEQVTRTTHLSDNDIGDIELTGRYQLTNGGLDKPILVANLRVKSDTGSNPYAVARNAAGVAEELAVGSGFWAVEPSLSTLIVSDPAVIFANLSYLHSFGKDINREIGGVRLGKVDPGDSIGASLGFGFSLNPRFSFSLGYRHNYIFRTSTELGPTTQKSEPLHIGALLFGMSYRVTPSRNISTQFEIGVTHDAPSLSVTLRSPFMF